MWELFQVRYYVVLIFVLKMFKSEKTNEEDYQLGFQLLRYLYETMAGIYVSNTFSKTLRIAWLSLSCISAVLFGFIARQPIMLLEWYNQIYQSIT